MANDRVFIKCKTCGGWKMLLKFYPTCGLQTWNNKILEWLDTHSRCHPNSYGDDLGNDPGYTLHTEEGLVDGSLLTENQNKDGTVKTQGGLKMCQENKELKVWIPWKSIRILFLRLLVASWGIPMSWIMFWPLFSLIGGVKDATDDISRFNRSLWNGF